MRVFVSDLHTTLGLELARYLLDGDHEVLGSVATRSQLTATKRRLQEHPTSDTARAIREPVALQGDASSIARLVARADVAVVTSLANDTSRAMELLKLFEKPRDQGKDEDDVDEEDISSSGGDGVKRFVAISSVLSWSKNAAFAKGSRGHSEDSFKLRKPARKYAALKTAETQILSARRDGELDTVVVAAGLLYGGAQSQFALIFRNAWMSPARDLLVPWLPVNSAGLEGAGSSTATGPSHGENLLPMISVYDLALLTSRVAVASISEVSKPYVVATDRASQSTTLRDLCQGLSVLLGNGKIRDTHTDQEVDDLLLNEDEGAVAPLQLHLCFDSPNDSCLLTQLVAVDEYKHVETGLLDNLSYYVADFITHMDLRPLRAVVLGAPRVGKTTLAQRLAKAYYLSYVSADSVLAELDQVISSGDDDDSGRDEAKPLALDEDVRSLQAMVQAWRAETAVDTDADGSASSPPSVAELPETVLLALLRWKLSSAASRNQGYVLDGLPVSVAQAERLWAPLHANGKSSRRAHGEGGDEKEGDDDDEAEGEALEGEEEATAPNGEAGEDGENEAGAEDGSDGPALSKSRSRAILERLRVKKQIQKPNRVILMNAPRELLEARAQTLSEAEALATENTESAFEARWTSFQDERESFATFFEQQRLDGPRQGKAEDVGLEVLELQLESEASFKDSASLLDPVTVYMEQGGYGKPNNFHPTREEIRHADRERERKSQEEQARAMQLELEHEERDTTELHARQAAEHARLDLLQREETELLEARAKPLRTYLMDTVLPALTEGLLEVVQMQPDDPVDYLAEFLFKKGQELEANAS